MSKVKIGTVKAIPRADGGHDIYIYQGQHVDWWYAGPVAANATRSEAILNARRPVIVVDPTEKE